MEDHGGMRLARLDDRSRQNRQRKETKETNITGDRFSPSVILFWFKTSIAASSMRVQCKSPNTLLGVIPLGSSTQTIPLRNIASVDTNIFLIAGLA